MLAHSKVDPVRWLKQFLEEGMIYVGHKNTDREVRQLE